MPLTPKLFRRQIIDSARSGEPVTPRCAHAPPSDMCGGCTFQDRPYPDQIAAKQAALRKLWAGDLTPDQIDQIGMVGSPDPFAYRTRMDYVASKNRFGLRRGGKFHYIIDLNECHLIPPAAFRIARNIYEYAISLGLPDYNLHTHVGFLRYVVVRRSPQEQLLLVVVTAAPDSTGQHETALEQLAAFALEQPGVTGFHWLINDHIGDSAFGTPLRFWGAELLKMHVGKYTLEIRPNTFFQNNVHLLVPLLEDLRTETSLIPQPRIADLYGGVGTIALFLAEHARQVTCVESVAESASLAERNIIANGLHNVDVVAADVLDFLRNQPEGAFDIAVADPPRNGLGMDVCKELLRVRPERIVYVSCNPLTQIEDARALAPGYRLIALRGYDMFPQTGHLESLAIFERITGES